MSLMTPVEIARLQHEITTADTPAALAAADLHAARCYWAALIDAATLADLHRQAEAHLADVHATGGGQ